MPSLARVNIAEIEEIWHYSFVIDVLAEDGPSFQYFGPNLATLFGQDYTGETISEAFNDAKLANTVGFYEKVLEKREPALEAAAFFLEGHEVRYRSIIVPLSSDDKEIDYLFGTTNYKIFSAH